MLKFPPIKQAPFPKGIIYHFKERNHYLLADSKSGNLVGEISLMKRPCDNLSFYNTEPGAPTLHIYSLYVHARGKGWGDYLIDFAKGESYRQGCEGRCSLVAHHSGRAPHTFYKKKGFITTDEAYNNFLDDCNAQGRILYYAPAKSMFIPIPKFSYSRTGVENEPMLTNRSKKMGLFERIEATFFSFIKNMSNVLGEIVNNK